MITMHSPRDLPITCCLYEVPSELFRGLSSPRTAVISNKGLCGGRRTQGGDSTSYIWYQVQGPRQEAILKKCSVSGSHHQTATGEGSTVISPDYKTPVLDHG